MAETIVDVFWNQVKKLGPQVALRRRGEAGWSEITWSEYGEAVRRVGEGLLACGIKPGDRVALMATNRPEWLYADLGALSIGAVTVPVYPTSIAAGAQHVVGHSEARIAIVDTAEQRDKLRSVRQQLPALELIVVMDGEVGEREITWYELNTRGKALGEKSPRAFDEARASIEPAGLATLVYTSGTTGPPKGAMLSHKNLCFEAAQIAQHTDFDEGLNTLSFLPLSHVAERLQGEMMAIQLGFTVNFGRGMDSLKEDLAEVQPEILTCVPRLWEKLYEGILTKVKAAPAGKQKLFHWAVRVGREVFVSKLKGRSASPWTRMQASVADRLVAKKLRTALGLGRARYLISGAAPLSPPIQEFFGGLGLEILEAYGQTECTGVSHGTVPKYGIKVGHVGKKLTDIEVRIAEDGEILVKGDNVFMGYYKEPEATAAAVINGWLHTGDVGVEDKDGFLRITDRKKDIIVTAGGKNVAPQNIENRLKAFQGISQVVVLGDKRKYLVALVTVDKDSLQKALGKPVADQPSKDAEVLRYVQEALDTTNRELSSFETVKKFAVLDQDFSIEGGELTPTLKVKRRVIDQRYARLVDGLYGEGGGDRATAARQTSA